MKNAQPHLVSLGALSHLSFRPDRALAMPTSMPAAPISGQGVFARSVMAGVAYVASPIPRLISMEVIEALRSALRQRSSVTVMRIIAVVDMAVEAVRAVKPRAGSKKQSAYKPIGSVVTVRSAVVRGIVEVPVRAHGSRSDVYADGNLGWCRGYAA